MIGWNLEEEVVLSRIVSSKCRGHEVVNGQEGVVEGA